MRTDPVPSPPGSAASPAQMALKKLVILLQALPGAAVEASAAYCGCVRPRSWLSMVALSAPQ
ncbi:hypothetical protein BFJ71_g16242 [Fusarium oxysporum]|nr:hypothetical protein FOMA001_g19420 [Fusarium oxysporum f. sp. matthiolae]RKK79364.1 hypothetical protein BFJ71_g16242 [Fusarium oxysporum]